jgi:CRP-like cAMP-binding protein
VPSKQVSPGSNCLLDSLPRREAQRFLKVCLPVELQAADILAVPGDPIPHVYFPIDSIISLMMPVAGETGLEVGLVGNEGMLGISRTLGVDVEPFHAVVQGAGFALRLTAAAFLNQLEKSAALQKILNRYLYVTMCQIAQTTACTHFHLLEARLARWLLMSHDRAHADNFHVTHAFLAYLLGVRRVGITKAANSLQQQNLITYRRGDVTILDRLGLEAASCGCYQASAETYRRVLG